MKTLLMVILLLVTGLYMVPLAGAYDASSWQWWLLMTPCWIAVAWAALRLPRPGARYNPLR